MSGEQRLTTFECPSLSATATGIRGRQAIHEAIAWATAPDSSPVNNTELELEVTILPNSPAASITLRDTSF